MLSPSRPGRPANRVEITPGAIMEIIAEIIFAIFGGIIEFLFSAVFQAIAELLSFIGDALSSRKRGKAAAPAGQDARVASDARPSPLSAALMLAAYGAGGVCAGAISLWLSPNLFLAPGWQRYANLLLMPLICGALTQIADNMRERPDRKPPVANGFLRGFIFALAMTAVRFSFGK